MAKMTFTKWLKQAKANTKIIERLEQIKYDYEQGKDLSYDDLAFLQSQQDFIKKEFCDDIVLWQIAGILELCKNTKTIKGGKNANNKSKKQKNNGTTLKRFARR